MRFYSTATSKVPVALIAELRKRTPVSLNKAREALLASNNSVDGALSWLEKDNQTSGAAKALKLSSRQTSEGLIALSVLSHGAGLNAAGGLRAALVELNCETDFVARNDIFSSLALSIAHTAAFISEPTPLSTNTQLSAPNPSPTAPTFTKVDLTHLQEAPLLSHSSPGLPPNGTVQDAIRDAIVKVGENISLRRASSIIEDAPLSPVPSATSALRLAAYAHGGPAASCGRVASLALLALRTPTPEKLAKLIHSSAFRNNLSTLENSLARQICGFDTLSVRPEPTNEAAEQALYEQPFIMLQGKFNGQPVSEALNKWSVEEGLVQEGEDGGIEVLDFVRWQVGGREA
ncbi:elongation factor TS-domain-containing protein [Panaeolus papilionaceus]|nr:elongation factor TS-domain-containing protein [Panaeolus papilionaceus]